MVQSIGRGGSIQPDAFYRDGSGVLVTPVTPLVDIIDPNSVVVVNNATPDLLGLGHYETTFPVPALAPLGAWEVRWTGVINGVLVGDSDFFQVVEAGSIGFTSSSGLCDPWITADDVRACDPLTDVSDAIVQDAAEWASEIAFRLTKRAWPGVCSDVWRPCVGDSCGRCSGACSCRWPQVTLPRLPVLTVSSVTLDGAVMDTTSYRVDKRRHLVRLDGEPWPSSQDLSLDTTEVGTFEVAYSWGGMPPTAGIVATAKLAAEFAKACSGQECQLPGKVTSVVREGVSVNVSDPAAMFASPNGDIVTGIYAFDLWVASVRRGGGPARVLSPDGFAGTRTG